MDLRTRRGVVVEGRGRGGRRRVEIRHRSLYPEKGQLTDVMISRADGENPAVQYYLAVPARIRSGLDRRRAEDVATADGSVLVHCAAGKDRTGVVVALALAAVGVERDAIIADYEATGSGSPRSWTACARRRPTGATWKASPTTSACRAEYLERVLEVLDERHGGAAGWLAEHGFDPAPLRERLLR